MFFIYLKKKNHVVDENVFIVIISYSYPEWKKCSKFVMIQAADEIAQEKKIHIVITKMVKVSHAQLFNFLPPQTLPG